MDMSSSAIENVKIIRGIVRRSSTKEKRFDNNRNDDQEMVTQDEHNNGALLETVATTSKCISRHSTSFPEITIAMSSNSPTHNVGSAGEEMLSGRRSSSRSSASASPVPLNSPNNGTLPLRRHSIGLTDSITSNNNNNSGNGNSSLSSSSSSAAAGAIPLTKNVGVSVNFGKPNVKSNSSSSAGVQHIIPNGHQHQQHTPGTSSTTTMNGSKSNVNCHNHNNSNSTDINLGHGHIGTIAGPPSVSITLGGGGALTSSSSCVGVNHNSSLSTMPAVSAPTTCTNKGVSSPHNQQQQHLLSSPQPMNSPCLSPHSPNLPMDQLDGSPEPSELETLADTSKNVNSSLPSSSLSNVNGGVGNNKKDDGMKEIPNSQTSTASTEESKGEPSTTKSDSTENSSSSNKNKSRIVSQNVNGTLAVTGVPSNESELQLFRVLQRANLLSYFDMMIELGGDDVQQLCDAGEEEFLEIMALIGMASKPLHVRRLQKALQEWMTQPSLFQAPVLPPGYPLALNSPFNQALPHLAAVAAGSVGQIPLPAYLPISTVASTGVPAFYPQAIPAPSDEKVSIGSSSKITNQIQPSGNHHSSSSSNRSAGNSLAASLALQQASTSPSPGILAPQQLSRELSNFSPNNTHLPHHQNRYSLKSDFSQTNGHLAVAGYDMERNNCNSGLSFLPMTMKIPADQLIPSHFLETRIRTRSEPSSPGSSVAGSPHPESRNSVSPVPASLQDHEVQKLAEAAIQIIRSLPPTVAEPKFSSKRKASGDYELLLRLSESDPRRMDEVRRVAAVYGRADAKRKSYKPLSLNELAINEAAAQLCKHVPAFLTKREELLSLSRQVVRESGLPYSAISSTFSISLLTNAINNANSSSINGGNNNNNNDINTKSKYEEISRINRHPSTSTSTSTRRDATENGSGFFNGFHAKRFRLEGSSGIEIQEYNRPPYIHESPSPPSNSNGMQITELRSLPTRRSPSDDHLPSPLELVTVTTSDLRKNGICSGGSKSSSISVSSMDSNSPPIRRPFSVELDDLNSNNSGSSNNDLLNHHAQGLRVSQTVNNVPSVKITSIPVSGGSISIMNHNDTSTSSRGINNGSNHHFAHHHHLLHHHHYNDTGNPQSAIGMKIIPIKSEPTVN